MAVYTGNNDNSDESTGCGIGSWRPKWLQSWATPKMFLLLFGLEGILQGGAYMYMVASLTTLERRYAFDSLVSGFILIADDVSGLIFSPFFGYLANHVHRPRFLGWSMILVSVGCFLATVPYIMYGPGVHLLGANIASSATNMSAEYCDSNRDGDSSCGPGASDSNRSVFLPVLFLWLCTALNGIGGCAFWTIGMPFIDDSVDKKDSPIYMSMSACLRLLGPTIAFLLSSYVLTFYENPLLNTGITDRRDPRWVGAWWIGFALMAVFIFIFALPLFMFPAKLKRPGTTSPDKNDRELVEKTQLMLDKKRKINENLSLSFRLWRLAKDPIFVCFVLGTTLRLFGVLGYMTFKPKYMESQYKKSASTANLFSGLIGIIPAAIGLILGGAYIKYLQPGPKLLTSFITVIELLGLIGFISALFLGCPLTPFAALPVNNANVDVQTLCNQDCACSSNVFKPICGPDNYTNYFSPCFAGCKPDSSIINSINNKKQYSSCECMGGEGVATEGYCPTNCGNNFEIYVTIFGVGNLVGTLARSGNGILSYRIVDEYDKSLASGIRSSFYSLFAFIPYPLVYGAVTNTACEVWESKCGQTGNCLVYDSDKFRNRLHGLTIILYLLGSVFDVIIIFLSSRIKNLYDDEEEDNDDNNVDNDLNLDEIEFRQ